MAIDDPKLHKSASIEENNNSPVMSRQPSVVLQKNISKLAKSIICNDNMEVSGKQILRLSSTVVQDINMKKADKNS